MTRPGRTTIAIDHETAEILERRGATKDRRPGFWNFTEQVRRTIRFRDELLKESDPRKTQKMPEDHYHFVIKSIAHPTRLDEFHLKHLGSYLLSLRLHDAATRASIDLAQLCATINDYPYAEKAHLVDAAQIASVSPATQAEPPRGTAPSGLTRRRATRRPK